MDLPRKTRTVAQSPSEKQLVLDDDFKKIDDNKWAPMTHTFGCNETTFNPANAIAKFGKLALTIDNKPFRERQMSGAELRSSTTLNGEVAEKRFSYGRFEARLKSSTLPGAVASMFLYRRDPWQEIDIEFLGSNPRKIQFNVFYNDGPEGSPNNAPAEDPSQLDLDFDASADFHDYAFEWEPGKIRWYVDGKLVYTRNKPGTTPDLPMSLRINHWLTCPDAADWAGKFEPKKVPSSAEYKRLRVWQ